MDITIDTTVGRSPISRYVDKMDFGISFADMDEMERLFGDFRDHNSIGHMEFGRADQPYITAVNVQDVALLRQFVTDRGWKIVEAR
jgi:hypothetical protein